MMKSNYTRYYRVFKHDTAVTEVSTNTFKPVTLKRILRESFSGNPVDVLCTIPGNPYSLPADGEMFYGYLTLVEAMEKAKLGAQRYIGQMIKEVEQGIEKLQAYRSDHYQDLNVNLLDDNIRKLEKEMHIK